LTTTGLDALPPAQRADLIYRAARAGLDQLLWQAALGRVDTPAADPLLPPRPAAPLSLDTLIEALGAQDRAAPLLTMPATFAAQASAPLSELDSQPPEIAAAGPLRLGPNAAFAPLLERAAARTGLDPAMLAAIVDAEAARGADGRWDPHSRNPRSSATGLGQFLTGTWLDEAGRPGSWLNAHASARGLLGGAGHVGGAARSALLALRTNPEAAIEAIADHAAANLRRLRVAGVAGEGRSGQARDAYLAHHLGVGDAVRFLGGGLAEQRAGRLLTAQVGSAAADRRIAQAGSAAEAHRDWLLAYVERRIRPARYLTA